MRQDRKTLAGIALAAVAAMALTACTSAANGSTVAASTSTTTTSAAPTTPPEPAKLTATPASGAKNVSPAGAIQVAVADGKLNSVALRNPDGKPVSGGYSTDHTTWKAKESLGYGRTYTWSGSATGTDGRTVAVKGSFHTLVPQRQIGAHLNVSNHATYGIAMPIVVNFDAPVTDKASVEKRLIVHTSPATTGGWAWLNDTTVHWRPKAYYAPKTKVTVDAKVYGVSFGDGAYGLQDVRSSFTIGRSQIVKGNTKTHRLVIYRNGKKIADWPTSYGLDADPGRNTHSGTHVVLSKSATYFMTNPQYHYENVEVHWAVRISNNGEFIHAAPWSVYQQGKENVSHGCANLSTDRAKTYYDSVLTGDPVEITGSKVPLSAADGDFYDWTIPWSKWVGMSALH